MKPTMYSKQDQLPPLPVPPLRQTLNLYLKHLQPLVSEEVFARSKVNVKNFLSSHDAETLHNHVLSVAQHKSTENWLDRWWFDSYLTDRSSPGVNVSPSFFLEPNPSHLVQDDYLLRAALLTRHTLTYHELIKNGQIEPGSFKGKPFCMEDYQIFFASVRVPGVGRDTMVRHKNTCQHIVVMVKGRIFKLDVYHPSTGKMLSVEDLYSALCAIDRHGRTDVAPAAAVGEPVKRSPTGSSVFAAVTSMNRDEWAMARGLLIKKSFRNIAHLAAIEESLFVLTLDVDAAPATLYSPAGVKSLLAGAHTITPDMGQPSAHTESEIPYFNRWHDKSFQLHVCANSTAAGTWEHSSMDSLPALYWAKHVWHQEQKGVDMPTPEALAEAKKRANERDPIHVGGSLEELLFDLDDELKAVYQKGLEAARDTLRRLDADAVKFPHYGGRYLSKKLGVSPDAFCQLALQMAFFVLRGYTPSTYESAATKTFLKGRTETIRTPTMASVAAVDALLKPKPEHDDRKRGELLRAALAAHGEKARLCIEGQGCDRHLFGLVCAAQELGIPLPAMFADEAFKTWSTIELSTTHPIAYPGLAGMTFGPVSEKCVGCGYLVHPDYILLSVTSWKKAEATRFAEQLWKASELMARVLVASLPKKPKKLTTASTAKQAAVSKL